MQSFIDKAEHSDCNKSDYDRLRNILKTELETYKNEPNYGKLDWQIQKIKTNRFLLRKTLEYTRLVKLVDFFVQNNNFRFSSKLNSRRIYSFQFIVISRVYTDKDETMRTLMEKKFITLNTIIKILVNFKSNL